MKQTPEQKSIEANLQPGTISADGFLGDDTRNLTDIIRADQAIVNRLSLSHQTIAARLRELTAKGRNGLGRPVLVDDHLEIIVEDYMGSIPCPFRDYTHFSKQLTTCKDKNSGRSIRWTDLNIHMIEVHGFYEGRGSPFRVEPADVGEILFQAF
ncbi:MAG: hypothetical protein SCM11_15935 [Bacillota bacterium]|nr:hypothetical protein [Bacillota bacterium]